jgi:hypothetical protein
MSIREYWEVDVMDGLAEWTSAACAELGIDVAVVDQAQVLELTRGMARPKAVLATYLLGVAVGRGRPPDEAAACLVTLAARPPVTALDWRD